MATVDAEWGRLLKAIWVRRLAGLAEREGGERGLSEAWSIAIAEAWRLRWDVDGIVPLRRGDPHGHQWAVVLSRLEPSADMLLIHGFTPIDALQRTPAELAVIS